MEDWQFTEGNEKTHKTKYEKHSDLICQLRLNPMLCIMDILFKKLDCKRITLPTPFCFPAMQHPVILDKDR